MAERKLRVGVLSDGEFCQWQINALNRMTEAGAEIETVIVNESKNSRIRYNLWNAPAYLPIAGSRELSVRFLGKHSYLRSVPQSNVELLDGVHRVHCKPIPHPGLGQELPSDVIDGVCSELDILVRFGFGIIRGQILNAPTYGVFSYHHGDIREYRGRPAGFWEFMNDEPTIGVTLQQLTDELDGGRVIQVQEFEIGNSDTCQEIMRTAYCGSVDMLAEAVRTIHENEFNPTKPDSLGDMYTAPDSSAAVEYFYKNTLMRWRDI